MRTIQPEERRARMARRHCLAPGSEAGDASEAAARLVALHATDPATVFLSAWARVRPPGGGKPASRGQEPSPGGALSVADIERALYKERSLVKHMAMRRTLWVVPRGTLGVVQAAASDRVAGQERRRLIREVEKAGLHADGGAWLQGAGAAVEAALADREADSTALREEIPLLEGAISYGEGTRWATDAPIGPRVLTVLSAEGRIVRANNDGAWRSSRPRWTATASWLGAPVESPPARNATATLVGEWLRAFGPGTAADIKWWMGSTVAAVRTALADLEAVEVDLGGEEGFVLPGDTGEVEPPPAWAALLPSLDPTPMGWKQRDWYLGDHAEKVFDSNGNSGPTAWWNGRVVGGWRQDDDGRVVVDLLEDVGGDGRAALEAEAKRLTEWLGGTLIAPRFPSPLFKERRDGG